MKVSATVDAEGRMGYRPLSKKQLSRRGLRVEISLSRNYPNTELNIGNGLSPTSSSLGMSV